MSGTDAYRVRFNDVRASYQELKSDIDKAIADVLDQCDFIGGKAIREFESDFALYTGAEACVGVANGTSAIHLALLAAGIGAGDEVITSPMTFIATSEAISLCGATPVFADIDPDTLNLDPGQIRSAITSRTRAIIFIHLHGNPSGAMEVAEIARNNHLALIEDCAQAHGARYGNGHHVGSLGEGAAYSFFPAKNLGAFGDAGAVTGPLEYIERVRQLANHGRSEKYLHQVEGMNARIDTLQAAILKVKLTVMDQQVEARNKIASRYIAGLTDLELRFQNVAADCRHAWHLFTIHSEQRDALQYHLTRVGIETGIHYPIPLHLQPAYSHLGLSQGSFPVAESTAANTLSLPMYPQLGADEVDKVIEEVSNFFS